MTPEDRAALSETWDSYGGQILRRMLDESIREPKDTIYELITSNPEKVIGKMGIRLGSRAKALEDFKESVEHEIKLLRAPTSAGRRV